MQRSKFVTSLGWLSVVFSVLMALLAGLEVFSYAMLSSNPELSIQVGLAQQERTGEFVDMQQLPSQLLQLALSHGLLVALGFPTAIGLLRRRDWARRVTIALIVGATVAVAPQMLWKDLPDVIPRWLTVSLFALVALIHADIVRRLMRPEIRAEFQVQPLVG